METMNIAKIEALRITFPQELVRWRNAKDQTLYRRVVGGLAWPRDIRPGALVVLVEHVATMPGQDMHKVEVAAEFTDFDPGQLLRRASLWGELLCCRAWMTPLTAPELCLAQDYNDARHRQRLPQLDFSMPPSLNGNRSFAAYDRLMERRTTGVKTLFYGEASQVSREYKSRQRADAQRDLELYPLLGAFLWALAAIDMDTAASIPSAGGLRRPSRGAISPAGY